MVKLGYAVYVDENGNRYTVPTGAEIVPTREEDEPKASSEDCDRWEKMQRDQVKAQHYKHNNKPRF